MEEIAWYGKRMAEMRDDLFVNQFTESIPTYALHIASYLSGEATGFSEFSTSDDVDTFSRVNKILTNHGIKTNKLGDPMKNMKDGRFVKKDD